MRTTIITFALFLGSYTGVNAQQETTAFDVNGVKVIFKPTVKTMVSVRVYFRGGVTNYTPEQAGIERFALSGAIECGTAKYTADQFRDTSDRYGIEMGCDAAYDYGNITMSCVNKYFDKGWALLSNAVQNPVYEPNEVQLLRNKIISSIREEDSAPDKHVEQLIINNAFAGTSYATDPDGTELTITSLSVSDLKKYYSSLLNKNRMFIVIAGKLTVAEITKKVASLVANLPSAPYKPVSLIAPLWNDNKTTVEKKDLATNYFDAVMNAPAMNSPDYLPFRLGMDALGGSLFAELRSKRNLSYAPGAYTTIELMPYAIMYVSSTDAKTSVEVMMDVLNHMKDATLSEKGLNEIKSSYITSNYTKLQSSAAITGNLGVAEIMGGWYYFENAPAMLEQVTPDQVSQAMKKYIKGVRWAYEGNLSQANEAAEAFKIPVK